MTESMTSPFITKEAHVTISSGLQDHYHKDQPAILLQNLPRQLVIWLFN